MGFEGEFLLFLQNSVRMPVLDTIFLFITRLGDAGVIWIALGLALCLPKKTRKTGVTVLLALLLMLVVNDLILKNIVARTRPYEVIEGLQSLDGVKRDYSFPSGHTASSFAAVGVMLQRLDKKWSIPALILAILIAFSRLYVGVHYPSDVLGGLVVGVLLSLLAVYLVRWVEKKRGSMGAQR